ncbi:uncharacterized protein LOC119069247 [Bradysia coprophila]|uniref:uncharacterized protein LOC119069247 n=1 Tax=Bradysia coprophila TaxID=38358 RepID=UPI00187D7E1A|nr:uncharacterized protein LOC119069247 [Bradysia coprophila]
MPNSVDSSNDSSEQERVKRAKSEKKREKRKLVESRADTKPGSTAVSNHTLDTFLDARKHIKTVRDKSTVQPVKISSDEEVWIFQCPKNIETADLLGRKIVLPQPMQIIQSKRGNMEFECKLELTKQEHHLTVICPTNGYPEAVSVKQAGMISIRERIKLPEPKENGSIDTNSTDRQFFYPTNLKIRHPLLGVNFDNIAIKQERDTDSIRISPKKKRSIGHTSSDRIRIKQEPDDEMVVLSTKKDKKRHKRPRESVEIKLEPDEEVQPSKKHKSNKKIRSDEDTIGHIASPTKHKRTSIKIEPDLV